MVVPAYNMEDFLDRTLHSALAQTYPNLEIIVVDDGSTDRTLAIAKRCADRNENVRVISVPNGGVATARNLGTRMARTPYVAYLDADDLWHPEKIARQIAALEIHERDGQWVGCYALSRFIDLKDRVLADGTSADARGDFFDRHLYRNHLGNGSCLLVRRDAALAVGGFDPGYAKRGVGGLEDYDFQLKLLRTNKLEVVREFLVGYRIYSGQMSDDLVRMARARIAMTENILGGCDLVPDERTRIMTHARLTAVYGKLWGGGWGLAAAELARAFWRAPRATSGMIIELAAIRFSRRRAVRQALNLSSAELRTVEFSEVAPTDGVAAGDNIQDRPPVRLAALRTSAEVAAPPPGVRPPESSRPPAAQRVPRHGWQ